MNKVDMEVYHQMGGTYVVPTEIMNALLDENETLNKGIDELIEKYNKRYDPKGFYLDQENIMVCEFIKELQDLKSLKGE